MARVETVSADVRDFTGGLAAFEVEARTVRALIRELDARFPGLGAFVDEKMALSIDGEIYQDAHGVEIGETSEVVLIPRIGGG
ncbi:MAG: MoaD/ThiS family protein [Maricaulaceae bacterium]